MSFVVREIWALLGLLGEALLHRDASGLCENPYYLVCRPYVGQYADESDARRFDMIASISGRRP